MLRRPAGRLLRAVGGGGAFGATQDPIKLLSMRSMTRSLRRRSECSSSLLVAAPTKRSLHNYQ
jgi:hypothetical protein